MQPPQILPAQPLTWAKSAEFYGTRKGTMVERVILWHAEGHHARKSAAGSYHLDSAGGRACWNGGRDFGTRKHFEDGSGTVKADAGRAGQIGRRCWR
jgi:hypothetical protein